MVRTAGYIPAGLLFLQHESYNNLKKHNDRNTNIYPHCSRRELGRKCKLSMIMLLGDIVQELGSSCNGPSSNCIHYNFVSIAFASRRYQSPSQCAPDQRIFLKHKERDEKYEFYLRASCVPWKNVYSRSVCNINKWQPR